MAINQLGIKKEPPCRNTPIYIRRNTMKFSEFRKQLEALGARFVEGAKHTKVYLNGKQTTLPRHGSQEIGEGLRKAVLRQLNVKATKVK